jgi:hypothetical protein
MLPMLKAMLPRQHISLLTYLPKIKDLGADVNKGSSFKKKHANPFLDAADGINGNSLEPHASSPQLTEIKRGAWLRSYGPAASNPTAIN